MSIGNNIVLHSSRYSTYVRRGEIEYLLHSSCQFRVASSGKAHVHHYKFAQLLAGPIIILYEGTVLTHSSRIIPAKNCALIGALLHLV